MKFIAATLFLALILLGCVTQPTFEASRVRAMTEVDKLRCTYITDITAWGHWFLNEFYSIDAGVDDVFNDMLNEVALVGGDGYLLTNTTGGARNVMQAWNCGWRDKAKLDLARIDMEPLEIPVDKRSKCDYIKTIAEASNWGFTEKRNYRNAKEDAITLVQEAGGDSYVVVKVIKGSIVIVILEAYRCNLDDTVSH